MSMVARRWALTAALATLVGGAAAFVLRVGLPPGEQSWSITPAGEGLRDRSLPALAVGDLAPDVDLVALDRSDHVALSSLLPDGKPTVLIFGSFT